MQVTGSRSRSSSSWRSSSPRSFWSSWRRKATRRFIRGRGTARSRSLRRPTAAGRSSPPRRGRSCRSPFRIVRGLAGTFLAGSLHHPSPALTGTTIFVTFAAGVLVQTTTTGWPPHRLLKAGIAPTILGLVILVASAWTSPPSLALFLIGGVVVGAGGGAILRGSLAVVIAASDPAERASALTTVFAAGYAGVSLPVVGAGLALQHLSPRVTLLIFGATVGAAILAASRVLVRASGSEQRPGHDSDAMTTMCRCFGVDNRESAGHGHGRTARSR